MLFQMGARTPVAQLLDTHVLLVYGGCALLLVAGVVTAGRRMGLDWNNAAFGALVTAFPNSGFMGVPLLVALLGPAVSGPVILTMLIDMVFTSSLCLALSRLDATAGGQGAAVALRNAAGGIVRNPMPWAIALGAVASAAGLALPAPVSQTVGLLAAAASPVALFTIGAVLARARIQASHQDPAGPTRMLRGRDDVVLALVKLLLHPLLVLGIGYGLRACGLPLDVAVLHVLALVAALPSASNVSLLTERYGADSARVARIIMVSTALAFASFAGFVAWLA